MKTIGIDTFLFPSAVRLSSVDFHKLRNVLEDFGQRSAVAQVHTPSKTAGLIRAHR
jgi:hypothetical protein